MNWFSRIQNWFFRIHPWQFVLLIFLSSRVLVSVAAVLAQLWLPMPNSGEFYRIHPDFPLLDAVARWDSGFYLEIAKYGYAFSLNEISNVAFFPLYPLLLAIFTPVFGDAVIAGTIISHACLFAALFYLEALTREQLSVATARVALTTLCFFPTTFFFSAVYTESLFFLCVVATFYYAQRQAFALASLTALLASSTRLIGVVLCVVLWLELWSSGRKQWHWMFVPLLAVVSYAIFLQHLFADPIAFWTVQPAFGRQGFNPILAIYTDLEPFFQGQIPWNTVLDLSALFLVLGLIPQLWKIRPSYAVYSALSVIIPLLSGTGSLSRYVLVLFPIFLLQRRVSWWMLISSIGLLMYLTALFATWKFVA